MSFSCDHGVVSSTNSTYLHADMPKINSSYVKICERRLARVSPASRPKILNCVVIPGGSTVIHGMVEFVKKRWHFFFTMGIK